MATDFSQCELGEEGAIIEALEKRLDEVRQTITNFRIIKDKVQKEVGYCEGRINHFTRERDRLIQSIDVMKGRNPVVNIADVT